VVRAIPRGGKFLEIYIPRPTLRVDIMHKKTYEPLPDSLRYLQSFVRSLARLAPDERNEDVDPVPLEKALRKRLRGLDEAGAAAELEKDRQTLVNWLAASASSDHPGHWVAGFLSSPDLASCLLQPRPPTPRGPVMNFEAPEGWKVTVVPYRLDFKKGKLIGTIMAVDEFSFTTMQRQAECVPPGLSLGRETLAVKFNNCEGKKFVARQPFKRVDYLLRVPGGFVAAMLSALGADFDEAPFESKLHTLRLSEPA
jgi:hypothetical protein